MSSPKYNVGDKFVVEIGRILWDDEMFVYGIKGFNTLTFDEYGLDRLKKFDKETTDEEILKIGDEVYTSKNINGEYLDAGIVVRLSYCSDLKNGISVMSKDGGIYGDHNKKHWHKTGRHFDIEGILNQIGEVNNDKH